MFSKPRYKASEIRACPIETSAKFGISFPMTEKVSVKGENAHPFYIWAKKNYGNSAIPKWNFHKIIIGKNGKINGTFASITNPSSKKFVTSLEKTLD